VPPLRTHQHRYFGLLASNSPLSAAVTALATPTQTATVIGAPTSSGACAPGSVALGNVVPPPT